jgi:UDPglucose 6-dehydrogenase
VYTIDLPGFGDSPINTNTIYDLNFFTKSIVNFINKFKIIVTKATVPVTTGDKIEKIILSKKRKKLFLHFFRSL